MGAGLFGGDWLLVFYFVIQLVGGIGLTVMLGVLAWPWRKRRNPVLISLCFSWWISTFPFRLLLFYSGHVAGGDPSHGLCLASAMFDLGSIPMVTLTSSCLVVHIWIMVEKTLRYGSAVPATTPRVVAVLVAIPYIGFVPFAMTVYGLGMTHPENVQRALFQCTLESRTYMIILNTFEAAMCAFVFGLIVRIVALVRQNRADMRWRGDLNIPLMMRVVAFGTCLVVGFAMSVITATNMNKVAPHMFVGVCDIGAILVFGTQRSIWHVHDRPRTGADESTAEHWPDVELGRRRVLSSDDGLPPATPPHGPNMKAFAGVGEPALPCRKSDESCASASKARPASLPSSSATTLLPELAHTRAPARCSFAFDRAVRRPPAYSRSSSFPPSGPAVVLALPPAAATDDDATAVNADSSDADICASFRR